jgi:outer membrane protein assembly factor BamE (lipoprotein component of BamABCDE complex)
MKKVLIRTFIIGICVLFSGCVQTQSNENSKIDNRGSLTLGDIQRDIKLGTTKSQVASLIGSPNIVSTEKNKEVRIYDKISTENT